MSDDNVSKNRATDLPRTQPRSPTGFQQIASFLYTQNPFYLLSVAFVLHSTRLWYRQGTATFDPWPLMGIIGGYILAVTFTGFFLVKFGKVWDDARSIFLILPLLFVELSLLFDGILISQPATGRALLAIGLTLAVAVSEGLLIGLRIRLPMFFRIPYHLILVLLFLYPLAIVTGLGSDTSQAIWRVYLFSPVAAAVLLTLLPAVRRGANYSAQSGVPWKWPWFPWSLFGFLAICLALRTYALTLSFDTVLMQSLRDAMRLDTAFGFYFLVPILLAVAVLMLEAGIVGQYPKLQRVALAIPLVCLVLSVTSPEPSAPYTAFLDRFVSRLGSPLWLSVLAGIIFLAYARLRNVRYASESLWAALLIASCIGPTTVDLETAVAPQSWVLWFVAIVQGARGVRYRRSWHIFSAVICLLLAVRADLLSDVNSLYRDGSLLNLAGLAVLIVVAIFDDAFTRALSYVGLSMLLAAETWAVFLSAVDSSDLPSWFGLLYGVAVMCVTFAFAYFAGGRTYFYAGLANLLLLTGRLLFELNGILQRLFHWEGAAWFVWGIVWLALGGLISACKGGFARRLAKIVPSTRHQSAPPPGR